MSQKHAFAFRASLAILKSLEESEQEPSEYAIQKTPILPLSGWLYLWTFTTPDVTTPQMISERWTDLTRRIRRIGSGIRWIRVFEPHESHGWHVHAVAVRRYDVTTIRTLAMRYGFGRIHVKRIPASSAGYVTKYLAKNHRVHRKVVSKFRLWACSGFKGATYSKVRCYDSWHHWACSLVGFEQLKNYTLAYIEKNALETWHRQLSDGKPTDKTMNKIQQDKALELLKTGAKIAFVEFRGAQVREASKFIDGRASLSEKTYYHRFLVEAGVTPLIVEERLPDNFKPSDVLTVPMKKGQTAILEFKKTSVFNGKETHSGIFHAIT